MGLTLNQIRFQGVCDRGLFASSPKREVQGRWPYILEAASGDVEGPVRAHLEEPDILRRDAYQRASISGQARTDSIESTVR